MYKLIVLFCFVVLVNGGVPSARHQHFKGSEKPKIIGGSEVPITDAPYFVQVNLDGLPFVGGTILNKNHILAPAINVDGYLPEDFTVRAGSALLGVNGSLHSVTDIKIHDKYDIWHVRNNVAVLTISPDLELDETRQSISLASVEPEDGVNGTVVGFGSTDYYSDDASATLQGTTIQVISRQLCPMAGTTEICGGDRFNGPYTHDAGSPLVVNGKLVGTDDFELLFYTCAFTSIPLVKDWIENNI